MKSINELELGIPTFIQRLQWILDPVGYMNNAMKQHQDLFMSKIFTSEHPILFVYHPEALQQILANQNERFSAPGELNDILTPIVGFSSLISLDGKAHKRERKLLTPSFHGERMHNYGQLICDITEGVFANFQPNQTFTARAAMQQISLQVILKAVFGIYEGDRCQKMADLIRSILNYFNSPINASFLFFTWLQQDLGKLSPWGRFLRMRQQLDEIIYAEIAERKRQLDPSRIDILSLLMSAQDGEGQGMSEQQLRDELMLLLFAGHETTALALTWALYWLHRHPQIKEKLLQELNSLGENRDPLAIYRLPYLTAVCNETLRIHSVAMLTFPRQVEKPVTLLSYNLEPGTIILGCIYLNHHRTDLYPEPEQFKPERFLEREYSQYEFIPFGGGTRRCLGDALAQYEMKLALATMLTRHDFALGEHQIVKPQRRGVVLSPKGGVEMVYLGAKKAL